VTDEPGRTEQPPPVPLARLMAMAFRDLIDGLHARLAERGWTDVRPAYGFVLLAARDGRITGSQVGELLGISKQAASKLLDAMVGVGLVERRASATDARARQVLLTDHGRRFLAEVEVIYADLEADWAAVIGADRVDQLRADLLAVLRTGHDGRLPAIRPTW
jgi:DNA-binding MarR family transcriptional regulator